MFISKLKIIPFEIDDKVFQISCYKYDRRIIAIFKKFKIQKLSFY